MAGPDQERMDALSEALARLVRRLDQIEARLQALERGAGKELASA